MDSSSIGSEDMQEKSFALYKITSGQVRDEIFQ